MRNILLIAEDWLRLVRSQKSFRILAGLAILLGVGLAAIEVRQDELRVFWSFSIPLPSSMLANEIVYHILHFVVTLLPLLTAFIAVFTTGGVVPEMIRKGRLEVMLARPVRRHEIVLGAYLGGLVFTAMVAAILLVATWVGLAVRGRMLGPAYFLNLPVIVTQYALISAVTVWLGFVLRSGGAAIVLTLVAWFVGKMVSGVVALRGMSPEAAKDLGTEGFHDFLAGPAGTMVAVLWWILPKPGELGALTSRILEWSIEPGLMDKILRRAPEAAEHANLSIDYMSFGLSSMLMVALLIGLATWSLKRRDL